MLVGGWAVDSYNSWYGSTDIDLVANSKTRKEISFRLIKERGFVRSKSIGKNHTIFKRTNYGPIYLDFGNKEERYRFEGRTEELNFDKLDGQTVKKSLRNRTVVMVPTRSLLLMYKIKAAWDRSNRIDSKTSQDEDWERGKLVKDYGDILALLDESKGGREVDTVYLGHSLSEFSFLINFLKKVSDQKAAIEKYARMDHPTVEHLFKRLLKITR